MKNLGLNKNLILINNIKDISLKYISIFKEHFIDNQINLKSESNDLINKIKSKRVDQKWEDIFNISSQK